MNWVEFGNIVSAVAVSSAMNSLWLGLLLVSLAAGAIRLLPRSNATTRHAIWFTALLLALVTPALLLIPRPAPEAAARVVTALPAAPALTAPVMVPVTAHWPVYAVLGWLAIAAIFLARVVWSLLHIHGLKRRSTLLGERGGIRVMASAEARVPMAAGFVNRAIVFPQSVLDELTAQEFEQILSHEMAHLRRWDDWTQLAHAVAQALFFFNPALYWIGRRLKIEREMACDDWVISNTGQARPYAACLTHLYELTRRAAAPQLAPGATGKKRWQLSARVEALLQSDRNSTPQFSRSGWMAACAMATAALLVAGWTTPPVGVQEAPVATLALVQPSVPAAPAITLTPRKFTPPRPRLLAMRAPELPAPPALIDAPIMLVRTWQVDASANYFVITVVFIEPPPAHALNGI